MGRWGFRLFEGDSDIDIACAMPDGLCIQTGNWEHTLASMVFQTDMLAPAEVRARYRTEEYKNELANEIVPYVRWKLDTKGLGDQLFAAYRAEETKPPGMDGNPRYTTIIFGALMLRAGAKIKAEDLQHLRALVPQVNCHPNWILGDDDFRTPGRAQFLAALDRYQPGVPSDFQEPSCFQCGKVERDTGKIPMSCKRCKNAWYCNKDCQRQHWPDHKVVCVAPANRRTLNV